MGATTSAAEADRNGCVWPAGLAAAQQLTRAGHTVTVSEREDASAGCCVTASRNSKMEKRHLIGVWTKCAPKETVPAGRQRRGRH